MTLSACTLCGTPQADQPTGDMVPNAAGHIILSVTHCELCGTLLKDGVSGRTCATCGNLLDNHDSCWNCEEQARDEAAYLASEICQCGETKVAGEIECAACIRAMEAHANRDFEEEERQERLLKALPDGDYTRSEFLEYLS